MVYFCCFLLKYCERLRIQREVRNTAMASDASSENKAKSLSEEKSPLPSSTTSLQNAVPTSTTTSQNSSTGNATTTSKPSTDSKVYLGKMLDNVFQTFLLC